MFFRMKGHVLPLIGRLSSSNKTILFLVTVAYLFLGRIDGAVGGVVGGSSAESYDFIVVGAGAAGCAVAGRLSEWGSGEHSVLLLEMGGYPDPALDIPALAPIFLSGDEYVRRYESVPQENAALATNGTVTYVVGKTLGGGSAVNGMVFNRGHPRDYQIWAERTGDPSWSYENMMRYFKRTEDYAGYFPSDQHGYGGPLTVSGPRYAPGLGTLYSAGMALGYIVADPNGPQQISFGPAERSTKEGRRVSSYAGYIRPFLNSRRNLKIITDAFARRIVFDGNRAVGIIYTNSLQEDFIVRANKEIIISTGSLESPALLMKSGIGPEEILRQHGIPAVSILPVGRNLQDHVAVKLEFSINDRSPSQVYIPERDLTPQNFALYNRTGNGPYSSHDATNVQAFLASSIAHQEGDGEWSDLQVLFTSGPGRADIVGLVGSSSDSDNGGDEGTGTTNVGATLFLTRPKSIGQVKLNGSDPEGDPQIDLAYFTHPDDLDAMVNGVKQLLQVYENTPVFQRLGARYRRLPLPRCDHLVFRSDSYWRCLIQENTQSGLHAVGTCSMGKGPQDPSAVLDTNLRVVGVEGLRVVDGSAIPKLTNANTEAPIYFVAEKASEHILQSWSGRSSRKANKKAAVSFVNWGNLK